MIPGWREHAACLGADPNRFIARSGEATYARLRRVAAEFCAGCPVRPDCAAEADRERYPLGLFGGIYRAGSRSGRSGPLVLVNLLPDPSS